jgi:hypothetical protein
MSKRGTRKIGGSSGWRAALAGVGAWVLVVSGAAAQGDVGSEARERFEALEEAGIRVAVAEGRPEEAVEPKLRLTTMEVADKASLKAVLESRGMAASAQNVAMVKELNPDLAGGAVAEGTVLVVPEVTGPPELTRKMRDGEKVEFTLNADAKLAYLAARTRLVEAGDADTVRFQARLQPFTEVIEKGDVHVGEELIRAMAADAEQVGWLARNPDGVAPERREAALAAFERSAELRNRALRGAARGGRLDGKVPVTVALEDADGNPVRGKRIRCVPSGHYEATLGDMAKLELEWEEFGELSSPSTEGIVIGEWYFWAVEPGKVQPVSEVLKKDVVKPLGSPGLSWDLQMRAD